MIGKGRLIQKVLERFPHLPFFLSMGYVIFSVLVVLLAVNVPDIGQRLPRFHAFASFILLAGPIVLTILHLNNIKRALSSIRNLAVLYIEIILMFGIVYFYLVSSPKNIGGGGNHIAISGVDSEWVGHLMDPSAREDKRRLLREALQCMQDCVHFSLITSTTVGYGDMVPKSMLAKLIVDIQVLICLFLISLGAGSVFARSSDEHISAIEREENDSLKKRLDSIEEKIDRLSK